MKRRSLQHFKNDPHVRVAPDTSYHFVAHAPKNLSSRPVVVGMGPAGLFAGLLLAQMGFRPLILERGKEVRERTKDTWGLWRHGVLNPESNVQFGEGGAGTFSDGKLYSQIKDPRYLGRKVLDEFVKAGAPEEILYESHPHIGTFRLVGMVEKMRETIQSLGGEIRFGSRVDDIEIVDGAVRGVVLSSGERIATDHLVLAVGHSARDTFEMIHKRGIYIEAKPFSIGLRIEHPQSLIDAARYGRNAGNPLLGAADYKLVHHASNGRSVYSFCMCPGGTVVAATSEPGRVVTNGMSQYSRNERNANSGIVVGITPEQDYPGDVAGRCGIPAPLGIARVRAGRQKLLRARTTGRRFSRGQALDEIRRSAAVLYARRAPDRSVHCAARLCDRRDPRSAARVRQADQGIRHGGCGADRRRDAHLLADPHQAQQGRLPEHQHQRACIRPAKARAMRAASFLRRWMESRLPKRWL